MPPPGGMHGTGRSPTMQVPPQIVFRRIDSSPAVEERVRNEIADLERFYDRIMSCRVAVERSGPAEANLFHVRVDVTVPGGEIVVVRNPPPDVPHEDLHAAIGDAFASTRRRLEDHARERRGDVKHHTPETHGSVVRLDRAAGFGFLRAT